MKQTTDEMNDTVTDNQKVNKDLFKKTDNQIKDMNDSLLWKIGNMQEAQDLNSSKDDQLRFEVE